MSEFGPRSSRWLAEVGCHTLDDVRAVGAVSAYARAKAAFPREVSLNLLWALYGALNGMPWHAVDAETKRRLKRELAATGKPR